MSRLFTATETSTSLEEATDRERSSSSIATLGTTMKAKPGRDRVAGGGTEREGGAGGERIEGRTRTKGAAAAAAGGGLGGGARTTPDPRSTSIGGESPWWVSLSGLSTLSLGLIGL